MHLYVHVITGNNGKTPTSGKWHSDKQTKNNKKNLKRQKNKSAKFSKKLGTSRINNELENVVP